MMTVEIMEMKKTNRDLDYLERRRERINSRRDSRGNLGSRINREFEDIMAAIVANLEEFE